MTTTEAVETKQDEFDVDAAYQNLLMLDMVRVYCESAAEGHVKEQEWHRFFRNVGPFLENVFEDFHFLLTEFEDPSKIR